MQRPIPVLVVGESHEHPDTVLALALETYLLMLGGVIIFREADVSEGLVLAIEDVVRVVILRRTAAVEDPMFIRTVRGQRVETPIIVEYDASRGLSAPKEDDSRVRYLSEAELINKGLLRALVALDILRG